VKFVNTPKGPLDTYESLDLKASQKPVWESSKKNKLLSKGWERRKNMKQIRRPLHKIFTKIFEPKPNCSEILTLDHFHYVLGCTILSLG
jgi:hypothetical protein